MRVQNSLLRTDQALNAKHRTVMDEFAQARRNVASAKRASKAHELKQNLLQVRPQVKARYRTLFLQ